jgi:uncharacterized membrane protein
MNKNDFLRILRDSLNGEVSPEIIEENIKYYDQYISTQPGDENQIIYDLGDPRLIAKTIIESEKAAKQKEGQHSYRNNYTEYQKHAEEQYKDDDIDQRSFAFKGLKWYHKLTMILVILIFLILLFAIGRFIIGFLFAFAVPILLVMLLFSMFRRRPR